MNVLRSALLFTSQHWYRRSCGHASTLGTPLVSKQAVISAPRARGKAGIMVKRPVEIGAFQFVVLSRLRATQLLAGCAPRLAGIHTPAVMAQMEVADGAVKRLQLEEGDDVAR